MNKRRKRAYEHRKKRLKHFPGCGEIPKEIEETIERSCLSKTRYKTMDAADAKAKQCTEDRGTQLRAYFCENCGGWHLTKMTR